MKAKSFGRAAAGLLLAGWLFLGTAGCGGGTTSTSVVPPPFYPPVNPPAPTATPILSFLSPSALVAGGVDFELVITGSGFLTTSIAKWNGSPRPRGTLSGDRQMSVKISAADIAEVGVVNVTVENPSASGGTPVVSNALSLTIAALRLNSVSPAWVTKGSGDVTLTISGKGFTPATVVRWNGLDRATQFTGASTVAVNISATELSSAGLAEIAAVNNTEVSNVVLFPIVDGINRTTELISDASIAALRPGVNGDGRIVAYAEDNGVDGFKVVRRDTCLNAGTTCVPSTETVSIASDGKEIKLATLPTTPSLSADGRLVAFGTDSLGFSQGSFSDLVVRTTCAGMPAPCFPSTFSPSLNVPFASFKTLPSLSADGRYLAFSAGESDGGYGFDVSHAFLMDTCGGVASGCVPSLAMTSINETGTLIERNQTSPGSLSATGRYVVYSGDYGDYGAGDIGIWVEDTCAGASPCTPKAYRISIDENGKILQSASNSYAISGDGRYVAFTLPSLGGGVFLRDTCIGADVACVPSTQRISVNSSGKQLLGVGEDVSISKDGRRVAFMLEGGFDVFTQKSSSNIVVRDTCVGVTGCSPSTVLLSVAPNGALGDDTSEKPQISGDGKYVVFQSKAKNLAPAGNAVSGVFRVSTGAE